jgi:TonB family protein
MAALALAGTAIPVPIGAQQTQSEESTRRVKSRVEPIYPELARKLRIRGSVRIEVVIAPNGTVKQTRIVGGHPVLADAAQDSARKWRFEPAPGESTEVIDFQFESR